MPYAPQGVKGLDDDDDDDDEDEEEEEVTYCCLIAGPATLIRYLDLTMVGIGKSLKF
jgi:hypothetical protein